MNDQQREALLSSWVKPSSDNEAQEQERAERMVSEALDDSPLRAVKKRVYAKGSYANNTNVRRDSDVDIAVDCHELMYYESYPTVLPAVSLPRYVGSWTPSAWRDAVHAALVRKFGSSSVDTSGSVAIHIPAVAGSRPNIDVVPGFHYRKYLTVDMSTFYDGSKVFPASGSSIINWPAQQLTNGKAKNDRTGKRYKKFVRALKTAENRLAQAGIFDEKASFLMECLIYNVEDGTLSGGLLSDDFRRTLLELRVGLASSQVHLDWIEPSGMKYMFRGTKKWTVDDGRDVVNGAWSVLGYS